MKEKDPIENFNEEQRQTFKKIAKELRHSSLLHSAANIIYVVGMVYFLSTREDGRELLKNPEFMKSLVDREKRTGLLEDSIFAPSLYHPNEEKSSITRTDAEIAGRWVSYDFRRPQEFKRKSIKQLDQGRLGAFPLAEIIDNSPDTFTPTRLLNIFDLMHLLEIEFPTIEELIEYGLIRETTYQKAYENVGLYNKYSKWLTLKNLNSEKIYQITPKGNGLVFLARDAGKKTEEKAWLKKLVPSYPF